MANPVVRTVPDVAHRVIRTVPDVGHRVIRAVPDVANRVVRTMASDGDLGRCDGGARRYVTNSVVRAVPDVTRRVIGSVPGMANRVVRAVPDVADRVVGTMASDGDPGRCDRGARRDVTNQVIRTVPDVTRRVIRTLAGVGGIREGGLQQDRGTSTEHQCHRSAHSQLLHPVALGHRHRLDLPARRSPAPCGRSTLATGLGACR
jgi:hypothetical protein